MSDDRRLLRSYPRQWRERYGAELLALVEDMSDGGGPTRSQRRSLLLAGAKEHLREQAIIGRDRPPLDRARAGARVILVAWAALVVAGCGFAKFSEHWQVGVPTRDQLVPELMYGVVLVFAAVGALTVTGVVVVALPSLRRTFSAGRWRVLRRPVLAAGGLSLVALAATAGLAVWAQQLTPGQRNGTSVGYLAAFLCWALLIVAMVVAWTIAAIAAERHLEPSPLLARAVWIGASVLSLSTVAIAAAILAWWIALARSAPWVLAGNQLGAPASPWAWPLVGEAGVAVAAAVVALLGATRLVSASRSRSTAR
jgi:hypothetical protein